MQTARRALAAKLAVALALAGAASPGTGCRHRGRPGRGGGAGASAPPAAALAVQSLTGQVVDARDTGIPGARVVALPMPESPAPPGSVEARTGGDGRFTLE